MGLTYGLAGQKLSCIYYLKEKQKAKRKKQKAKSKKQKAKSKKAKNFPLKCSSPHDFLVPIFWTMQNKHIRFAQTF